MSITPTFPGVYITEVPSGNRALNGVATSITAFVGAARRGPVDHPVAISNFTDFGRVFGSLDRRYGLGYAVRDFYLSGGGPALVVRVAASDAKPAVLSLGGLKLRATGPGAWANDLLVTITHPTKAEATDIVAAQGLATTLTEADFFTMEIRDGAGPDAPFEVFRNLTVVDGPARVDRVLASSQWVRVDGSLPAGAPATTSQPVKASDPNKGSDGDTPGKADYVGDPPGAFRAAKRGLYALEKADLVNLIVLPPPAPASDLPDEVWVEALSYAAVHRAFLIVDPPAALALDQAAGWAADVPLVGLDARNAALFYPRVRHADPLNGGAIGTFAPGGAVAGVLARTDASRGVWKAPAGLEAALAGVVGLSLELTNEEQGTLNPRAVNVLRSFPDAGRVIWGSRTLRGADVLADEYKYIPVRRLALFLEESLYRGTQWVVFEPNDEPLWSQIRLSVGAFMHDLFVRGAFQGSSPQDAYFVRCDAETTTQYDIDRGIVNIRVGFAPLKPAEFVMISIQQKTASATA